MDPLTQTRQMMVARLPEYRPFAMQELVRAASFHGGAAQKKETVVKMDANRLLPMWLDMLLYMTAVFIVGAAFFMVMYHLFINEHTQTDPDPDEALLNKMFRQEGAMPPPHPPPPPAWV